MQKVTQSIDDDGGLRLYCWRYWLKVCSLFLP